MKFSFRSVLKNSLLTIALLAFCVIAIETGSYLIMKNSKYFSHLSSKKFFLEKGNIPAQIHLNDNNIYDLFRGFLIKKSSANISIEIDSEETLIKEKECLEWYDKGSIHHVQWRGSDDKSYIKNIYSKYSEYSYQDYDAFFSALKIAAKGKKIIVTLGGSTSAWAVNWPYFFSKKLDHNKYIVLNLAEPGGMTANHIKIVQFFLPKIKEYTGNSPHLVISLDGFNDMYTGNFYELSKNKKVDSISGAAIYIEYLKQGNKGQEGIAKKEEDRKILNKILTSQFFENSKYVLARVFPYTLSLLTTNDLSKKLELVEDKNGDEKLMIIPQEIQGEIVDNLKNNLVSLKQYFDDSGVSYYSYLQPVALEKYHHYLKTWWRANLDPTKAWAATPLGYNPELDVNYVLDSMSKGGRFGTEYVIFEDGFYAKAEDAFQELDKKYKTKSFTNLAPLFMRLNEGVYMGDAVHYVENGAIKISDAIFLDLKAKGIVR